MAPARISTDTSHSNYPHTKANTSHSAAALSEALEDATSRFTERNTISLKLHNDAIKSLPGGNTRSLLHTTPFPVFMKSGKSYQVTSEDNHTYTDFVGELTAGLYGHSHPTILSALSKTLTDVGLNLGANTAAEARYASLLCSRFKLDRIRFCNSGTEANLHALAGARKYTGRRKVVVFKGGYHGAVLSFGSGVAENNVDRDDWIVGTYNDAESVTALLRQHGSAVAAVLVEAMQGSGGCIPAEPVFLDACQTAAHDAGALFILDEVMTSRLAPGGLRTALGLEPDLTTFGKYLGGGLAFGAFGGAERVMSVYDPRREGALSHSGTFNNNTLAMHAGYAGLEGVYTPEVCEGFSSKGDAFRSRLNDIVAGTKCCFTGCGTIMAVHFTKSSELKEEVVVNVDSVDEDWELKDLFWYEMMEEGFWITRRGSFALIVDTPDSELDRFVQAVRQWVTKRQALLKV